MKCIQTENSDVHSMYYGSLHFILFWGIAGNSPIFPEHIYFLNPRPVPTVSEKTVLVPVPEYWGFSGRGTICPQNGFPSPPRNSPKHFHKALPIPAPSPKLGEGDGFPQVSRPRLASLDSMVSWVVEFQTRVTKISYAFAWKSSFSGEVLISCK